MKNPKKINIVIYLFLSASLPVNAYCSSRWDQFLQNPTKNSLMIIQKSIKNSMQHCHVDVIPVQQRRMQLFELIGDGNPLAFRAGLLVSECLDGGDLEDFYRSTGVFFEKQPQIFMHIVKDQEIQDTQLKYMLTMLPLNTVDNINLKLSVIENRISILKSINNRSLIEIKENGLILLEKERQFLERTSIQVKHQKSLGDGH